MYMGKRKLVEPSPWTLVFSTSVAKEFSTVQPPAPGQVG